MRAAWSSSLFYDPATDQAIGAGDIVMHTG